MTVAAVRPLPVKAMEPAMVSHPLWCDKGDGEPCDVVDDSVKHRSRRQTWILDGDGEVEVTLCLERWDYMEVGHPQGRTEVNVYLTLEDLDVDGDPVEARLTRDDALFLARQLVTAARGAMTREEVDALFARPHGGGDRRPEPAGPVYEAWKTAKLAEHAEWDRFDAEYDRAHPPQP